MAGSHTEEIRPLTYWGGMADSHMGIARLICWQAYLEKNRLMSTDILQWYGHCQSIQKVMQPT